MTTKLHRRALLAGLAAFAAAPGTARAVDQELTDEEFGLLRRVNEMRRARGLKTLRLRLDLSQAARDYARLMAEKRFFSHTSPEGDGPTDRADAVGYDWRRLGETLAAGQATPEETAAAWRDSPGHADIIFDPGHRHVGVGYWRRPSADPLKPALERYWVLLAGDTR